jgi:hypothetical protein
MGRGLTMPDPNGEPVRAGPARLAPFLIAHVVITAFTWRDLQHRSDDQVRGSKKIWRMASAVNTLGSLAYWLFGRQPGDRQAGAGR